MVDIHVERETTAPPEAVLASLQEPDLERRHRLWSNVKPKHSVVHETGDGFIEITEGDVLIGISWERSRYEWAEPGAVTGTVLESNVFRPGSTFTLRARLRPEGGSLVELHVRREFRRTVNGIVGSLVNHVGGGRLFGWYLGTVLATLEEEAG